MPQPASPLSNRDPVEHLARLADQCVLCGLCLPHCPTYALDQLESESPRGRISLMHALAESRIDAQAVDFSHLDHCLACRRCEAVCPSGVRYGELLHGARAWLREEAALKTPAMQRVMAAVLARARLLDRLLGLARPFWRWMPRRIRDRLPPPPLRRKLRSESASAPGQADRGEIALFLGCIARRYASAAQQTSIDLLHQLGWTVVVPNGQGCCGAQARHSGDAALANRLEDANQRAFAAFERIATLDTGCHESLNAALHGKARDILDLLADDSGFATLDWRTEAERVAVFAPCTQHNVVGSDHALRQLLALLPGVDSQWLHAGCCGAAGDHMLRFPERAAALRQPLLDQLAASGCERLLVANIGCRLHLQAGIDAHGLGVQVQHPLEYFLHRLHRESA